MLGQWQLIQRSAVARVWPGEPFCPCKEVDCFMTLRLLSLILFSVSLSAVAQLLLKIGVGRAGAATAASEAAPIVQRISDMLFSPFVLLGLMTYAVGTLVWLFVLAKAPLSVAYPFVGAGFILTALMGALVLGEQLSPLRVAGVVLITLGCTLVARSV